MKTAASRRLYEVPENKGKMAQKTGKWRKKQGNGAKNREMTQKTGKLLPKQGNCAKNKGFGVEHTKDFLSVS